MKESKDFLYTFTENLFNQSKSSLSLYGAVQTAKYDGEYNFDSALKKLNELKEVSDKILSIIYNPHIKVETNEIIKRSEVSGKLSHDDFSSTMRDPQLWKEKNKDMVPEYVHTIETIDSIDTYENRFISLLIDSMDKDIDRITSEINPLVESIEEHYQHKEVSFGKYSFLHNLRTLSYPYQSFILKGNGSKEELLKLARKIKRRTKNFKSTEFYKITGNKNISRNIMPTNILIHDKLYSFCYKYYVANYRKEETDTHKRDVLFANYFICSFINRLRELKCLVDESVMITFTDRDRMIFTDYAIVANHYPFTILFAFDEDMPGMNMRIVMNTTADNDEPIESNYYFIFRENYTENNSKSIYKLIQDKYMEGYDRVIIVTMNNVVRYYHECITFSYYRDNRNEIIDDLLSSMTIIFDADKDLYSSICPVCGHNHIRYDGKIYKCDDCSSSYIMKKEDDENLLWIRSLRKEL